MLNGTFEKIDKLQLSSSDLLDVVEQRKCWSRRSGNRCEKLLLVVLDAANISGVLSPVSLVGGERVDRDWNALSNSDDIIDEVFLSLVRLDSLLKSLNLLLVLNSFDMARSTVNLLLELSDLALNLGDLA